MTLEINEAQAHILRQLLDFHIENLIDEPANSPRGEECRQAQAIFDALCADSE